MDVLLEYMRSAMSAVRMSYEIEKLVRRLRKGVQTSFLIYKDFGARADFRDSSVTLWHKEGDRWREYDVRGGDIWTWEEERPVRIDSLPKEVGRCVRRLERRVLKKRLDRVKAVEILFSNILAMLRLVT
jgi:hypothetical protein